MAGTSYVHTSGLTVDEVMKKLHEKTKMVEKHGAVPYAAIPHQERTDDGTLAIVGYYILSRSRLPNERAGSRSVDVSLLETMNPELALLCADR